MSEDNQQKAFDLIELVFQTGPMRHRLFALCLAIVSAGLSTVALADSPEWMRAAAARKTPTYGEKVTAVVLVNEQSNKVEKDGRIIATTHYAVRILTREGKGHAFASALYMTDTGKVRELRAWLIRSTGDVKQYDKNQVIDVGVGGLEEYNEVRRKTISGVDDAEPGSVFGYEAVTEDRSVFTQFEWHFQSRLPVLSSRFELTIPEEWRAESITFNRAAVAPVISGSTYSWELRDLPEIESEVASPEVTNLAPRLAVNVYPPKTGNGSTFSSWREVSRWLSELSDPQAASSDQLSAKARSLTDGVGNELERIRKIGRYAQSVKYVSIQIGIGRGGGYRPHAATEVLNKGYGDCKDKANLMRAMLVSLGMSAYLVSIYSGDSTYVREEWASPQQFNHCIVAVKVSDQMKVPSIVDHPRLGRLLIFDPTDEDTPVGDLPDDQQGSLALIVAGDDGLLMRMPSVPLEANHLERQIDATLQADGSINARVRELSTGIEAVGERRQARILSGPKYKEMIERWITRGVTASRVSRIEPVDERDERRFKLEVDFVAPNYAQPTGKLLLLKPAIISRREGISFSDKTRKHPIVMEAESLVEKTRLTLPAGFIVDELPDKAEFKIVDSSQPETPFARYVATYEAKDGELIYTRTLLMRGVTLPVERYEDVKQFFARIREAELAPVVLIKK
jgi:hypothetical protein